MGTYKKFEDTDILHNYLVATPHHEYFSGTDIVSGAILLYNEPFAPDGSAEYYIGFEEGSDRSELVKYNESGSIQLHYISASSSGSERARFNSVVQELSGSRKWYSAHAEAISGNISEKMMLIDISSAYYDQKIKDCIFAFVSGVAKTATHKDGVHIRDTASNRYAVGDSDPIIYHDHSGSLKIGSGSYLYNDDDGEYRYQISASSTNTGSVTLYTDAVATTEIDLNETVGYMIPEQGLAALTDHRIISASHWLSQHNTDAKRPSFFFMASLDGHHEIPVNTYLCHVDKGELNHSQNPSYYNSGSQGQMYHSGAHTTYVTKIGLYNKSRQLIAVGSLAQPVRHKPGSKLLFKLHMHR